jgi:hypothetical protein
MDTGSLLQAFLEKLWDIASRPRTRPLDPRGGGKKGRKLREKRRRRCEPALAKEVFLFCLVSPSLLLLFVLFCFVLFFCFSSASCSVFLFLLFFFFPRLQAQFVTRCPLLLDGVSEKG